MNHFVSIAVGLTVSLGLYFLCMKRYSVRQLIKKSQWDYYLVLSINDLNCKLTLKQFMLIIQYLKVKRVTQHHFTNKGFNWLFTELKENESDVYFQHYTINKLDFNDLEKRKVFLANTLEALCGIDGFVKH